MMLPQLLEGIHRWLVRTLEASRKRKLLCTRRVLHLNPVLPASSESPKGPVEAKKQQMRTRTTGTTHRQKNTGKQLHAHTQSIQLKYGP